MNGDIRYKIAIEMELFKEEAIDGDIPGKIAI